MFFSRSCNRAEMNFNDFPLKLKQRLDSMDYFSAHCFRTDFRCESDVMSKILNCSEVIRSAIPSSRKPLIYFKNIIEFEASPLSGGFIE